MKQTKPATASMTRSSLLISVLGALVLESRMRDALVRVKRALPAVRQWVTQLHAQNALNSAPPAALGFERLERYFPPEVLQRCRAVAVVSVPFPPLADLDLPEFEVLASMPMAGITFGHMYFVRRDQDGEAIHFHELVHTVQWAALGFDAFLSSYAVGILQHGYEASPLEFAAYDLQASFERGEELPDVVDFIRWHANETQAATASLFESLGIHEGA
jgi:hypothetical protein